MKLSVFGNFGVKNLGDDLILMGFLELFKDHEITVFCGNPKQVKEQFGLAAYSFFPSGLRSFLRYVFSSSYRKELQEGFKALQNSDHIMIGGGGILVDRFLKAIFLWWRQLSVIRRTQKHYEFIANSFELNRWWTRKLFFPFFKGASKITVRDSDSKKFIEALGLQAELTRDLSQYAIDMKAEYVPFLRGFWRHAEERMRSEHGGSVPRKKEHVPPVQKKLTLAFSRWGLHQGHQRALRSFIAQKKSEGWDIVGLAFQTMGDDDRKIIKSIDSDLRIETELQEILNELSTSNLLIGMRLHSLILAEQMNIPMIALAHQTKVISFMKDQRKASQVIPIQNFSIKKLQEIFEAVLRQKE